LIGERISYQFTFDAPVKLDNPHLVLPDSLLHFELLGNDSIDIEQKGDLFAYRGKAQFTSFDSGNWVLPSFAVVGGNGKMLGYTDSLPILVSYATRDSSKQLRDIRPIILVEVKDYFWWMVGAAVLGALLLLWLIYRMFFKGKSKAPIIGTTTGHAYDQAIAELNQLRQLDIAQPQQMKTFHNRLQQIYREYYSASFAKQALQMTTGDLLLHLQQQNRDGRILSEAAAALRLSDAVKFAKFLPDASAAIQALEQMQRAISHLNNEQKNNAL
jgi:hypothetical protein